MSKKSILKNPLGSHSRIASSIKRDTRNLLPSLLATHWTKLVYSRNSARIFNFFRKASCRKADRLSQFTSLIEHGDRMFVQALANPRRTSTLAFVEITVWDTIITDFLTISSANFTTATTAPAVTVVTATTSTRTLLHKLNKKEQSIIIDNSVCFSMKELLYSAPLRLN